MLFLSNDNASCAYSCFLLCEAHETVFLSLDFHEQNGSKRWSVCCAIFKIVLFESTQSFKDPKTTSLSDSLYCLMFTNSIHYIHYSIDLLWLIPIQISINCRMSFNNRNTFISGLSTDIVTNLATSDGQMSSKFSASITNFVIC